MAMDPTLSFCRLTSLILHFLLKLLVSTVSNGVSGNHGFWVAGLDVMLDAKWLHAEN